MNLIKGNIGSIVHEKICTGCGTCVGICPTSAISIKKCVKDYDIKIDPKLCNNCGICLNVCASHLVDYSKLNASIFGNESPNILMGNYVGCYTGYSTDKNLRYNCASGGLTTQILIFALENNIIDGALVTRLNKDNPLEPEVFIAQTKEDIISASGSKYCPVPLNKSIKEILRYNGKIAVVGLPCHINGLRKAEDINMKLKEKIKLHIGIFCSRTDNFEATEFYFNWFGIKASEVKKIDYRSRGWPGYMKIKLKGGNEKLIPYKRYIRLHELRFFTPKSCSLCHDLTCELSDISFGDAWLPEIQRTDNIGTSICISRTKYSNDILEDALSKGVIKLDMESINIVKRSQGVDFKKKYSKVALKVYSIFDRNLQTHIRLNEGATKPRLFHYFAFLLYNLQAYILSRKPLWICIKLVIPFEGYLMKKFIGNSKEKNRRNKI
jgi:coenzyme F420 hydrogenase subunit beta